MILKVHPGYPTLPIIVAQSTGAVDYPKPGKFYVVPNATSLSWIAAKAYGSGALAAIKRINQSQYNMTKCIYRKESSKCSSAKVNGALATSNSGFGAGAWLALCPADKAGIDGLGVTLGVPFQVIWIPPLDGKEPWDLAPPAEEEEEEAPPSGVKLPDLSGGEPVSVVTGPINLDIGGGSASISVPGLHIGGGSRAPSDGTPTDDGGEIVPQKAGMPWWIGAILGLGAITTVIYFAVKDKKKRGKKRK